MPGIMPFISQKPTFHCTRMSQPSETVCRPLSENYGLFVATSQLGNYFCRVSLHTPSL